MKAVWPDCIVEENNLAQNISTLRRIFGDSPSSQRYIVTVPGRGYRFVPDVREASDSGTEESQASAPLEPAAPASSSRRLSFKWTTAALAIAGLGLALAYFWNSQHQTPPAPSAVTEKSIAVLPFANLSADPENAYFTEGMQEEILIRLSKLGDLKVISRTSTQKYKSAPDNLREIAQQLGVAHILEGSVQRSGENVRITVQLIHAQSDTHLWAESYDRKLTEIFQVETDVSQRIVTSLAATLTGSETRAMTARPTANVEAHQAYLKGRFFWNKRTAEGYQRAIEHFNRAIELDPSYASAYAGLADALLFVSDFAPDQKEAVAKGRRALQQALALDETLAEAHASLGILAMNFDWDWPAAEREFKRAIVLNSNYATAHQWYGEFLADLGRPEEAIAEIKRAYDLDPLSIVISTDVGKVYMLTRRYDEAIAQFQRSLELDAEFAVARGLLAFTYSLQGNHSAARAELRKIRSGTLENDPMFLAWAGYVYGRAGDHDEAGRILARLDELSKSGNVSPLWPAIIYAGLKDNDQTFAWFEKVIEQRAVGGALPLKANPLLDHLRSDPRFADLLRRTKLDRTF